MFFSSERIQWFQWLLPRFQWLLDAASVVPVVTLTFGVVIVKKAYNIHILYTSSSYLHHIIVSIYHSNIIIWSYHITVSSYHHIIISLSCHSTRSSSPLPSSSLPPPSHPTPHTSPKPTYPNPPLPRPSQSHQHSNYQPC